MSCGLKSTIQPIALRAYEPVAQIESLEDQADPPTSWQRPVMYNWKPRLTRRRRASQLISMVLLEVWRLTLLRQRPALTYVREKRPSGKDMDRNVVVNE